MKILVTAGNTWTLIDKVRCITNIFTGRTGAAIALAAQRRGHDVTLLTSHPEAVASLREEQSTSTPALTIRTYRTFEDLHAALADTVPQPGLDAIIHAAAVSDYRSAGVFAPTPATRFQPDSATWESADTNPPGLVDMTAGKIKSDAPELWLRLVRTPKLVDLFRSPWGFRGVLVKFKLEVGLTEARLLDIAEQSRRQSDADLLVANTLEDAGSWAYLGPVAGQYEKISRRALAERVLASVEQLHQERAHE